MAKRRKLARFNNPRASHEHFMGAIMLRT
jgi:hypothetical protein